MIKHCILCGDVFNPKNGTSQVCYHKQHIYKCTSCDKEILVKSYKDIPKFKNNSIIPYFILDNNKDIFEFTHTQLLCKECIKQQKIKDKYLKDIEYLENKDKCVCDGNNIFLKAKNKRICYKKKHYFICSYCNNKILFRSKNDIPENLPYKILIDNDEEFTITYIDHYCRDCQKNNPAIKQKHNSLIYDRICNRNLEKYGEYCYQTKEVKSKSFEKCKETMKKKYGVEYSFHTEKAKENSKKNIHSKEAEEKRRKTCLDKYGVDNYAKTNEFKEYISEFTSINMRDPEIQKKRKLSTLKSIGYEEVYYKPGHANKMIKAASSPVAKEKYRQTMIERYGVPNAYFLPGHADKMIEAALKSNNNLHKCSKVNQDFKKLLNVNNIECEQEFYINRKSFDFHILNTNILIEINPTVTHNSTISFLKIKNIDNNAKPLDKDYHMNRLKFAENNNYILLNVWDWTDRTGFINILISYLNNISLDVDNFIKDDIIDFNYYQLYKDKLNLKVELINYCYLDDNKEVYIPSYKLIDSI